MICFFPIIPLPFLDVIIGSERSERTEARPSAQRPFQATERVARKLLGRKLVLYIPLD